jgi:hypothetical protein
VALSEEQLKKGLPSGLAFKLVPISLIKVKSVVDANGMFGMENNGKNSFNFIREIIIIKYEEIEINEEKNFDMYFWIHRKTRKF